MDLNTLTLSELTDLVRREFVFGLEKVPKSAQSLFVVTTVGKGQGNSKRYTEIDVETFASNKPQGVAATKARVGVGYSKDAFKKRVAKEIDITQEMIDENRYSEVGAYITSLSDFAPNRMELDLTHRLTFANATSYTDMDGDVVDLTTGADQSVINTAHTLRFSTATYNNRVTGDPVFSQGALLLAEEIATTQIVTNYNEKRVMMFNTIVTSDNAAVIKAVTQVLQSGTDIDQNNPGVKSFFYQKYRHVVLPYLASNADGTYNSAKKNWWFLVATGQGQARSWQAVLNIYEAPHMPTYPRGDNNAVNTHTDVMTYGIRAGYAIAVITGRGIIGSLPTS